MTSLISFRLSQKLLKLFAFSQVYIYIYCQPAGRLFLPQCIPLFILSKKTSESQPMTLEQGLKMVHSIRQILYQLKRGLQLLSPFSASPTDHPLRSIDLLKIV